MQVTFTVDPEIAETSEFLEALEKFKEKYAVPDQAVVMKEAMLKFICDMKDFLSVLQKLDNYKADANAFIPFFEIIENVVLDGKTEGLAQTLITAATESGLISRLIAAFLRKPDDEKPEVYVSSLIQSDESGL
jgi:hypothetical protein